VAQVLRAGCLSCHPINNIKALIVTHNALTSTR